MKLHRVLVVSALAVALCVPAAFAAPQDKDKKEDKMERKEKHPEIRECIKQLEKTKWDLEHKAASDFHGHKVMAIKSIDEAIGHLREGLAADKD
jgi:hypothetical protein